MRKTKKAIASLAIAGMVLSMAPLSVFGATTTDATRIAGADRYLTSIAVAEKAFTTATSAVIAAGNEDNLVDALAAAPLAAQEKAPIMLTDKANMNDDVKAELSKLGVKTVYVVGAAASTAVVDELTAAGFTVEKIQGADRTETTKLINAKLTAPKGTFVVGYNATADAMSAASFAAANNYAIVVANPDGSIPDGQAAVGTTYVLGGPTLVKDVALATRIYGADRYETNQKVLAQLAYEYGTVYVANGETLVDALVASVLAGQTQSPIALTDGTTVKAAAALGGKMAPDSTTVALGGTSVVSDAVKNSVAYVAPATLAVQSVTAIDGKDLKVTFNKAANKDSLKTYNNFTFKVTTGSSITLNSDTSTWETSDDLTSVTIPLTGNFYNGQSYKVSVDGVLDSNFAPMTKYTDSWHLFNDTTAPVLQSAAVKSGKLRLTFDEAVQGSMTVKVDGVQEATTVTPSTTAGATTADVTVSADALKTGTHNVIVYNAKDWAGLGNVSPIQTVTYTVTDDTTAPSVVSVVADGGNSFKVQFSEAIDTATLTTSNFVVKKGNATITTTSFSQDSSDKSLYTVYVDGTSDVSLYDTNATSTTLNVAVKNYHDGSNLYGAEYDATITLTKDTTGPAIVSSAVNTISGTNTLVVRFNEDLGAFSYDASKITVVKDGVLQNTTSSTTTGTKALNIVLSNSLSDGTYNVSLASSTVKDTVGNGNLALNTTVVVSNSAGTAYTGTITTSASTSGSADLLQINYNTTMSAIAADINNYQLDGMPLPTSATAYFTDASKQSVVIKFPAGTIDNNTNKLLAFSTAITTDSGNVIKNSDGTQKTMLVSLTDNIKPVLSSGKFVISTLSDTTTQTIKLTFNEIISASDKDDFKVTVNGVKIDVASISVNGTDKNVVLTLASTINMSQAVSVEVVKAADQTDTTMGTKDASTLHNTLTEGTVISVTEKTL